MNISVLLPNYVKEKHPNISSLAVGIIFSSYQVFVMITAPIMGSKISSVGRRKAILIGLIVMTSATAAFAFASFFENDLVFYSVSFVARALQGTADSFMLVAVPSVIAIEWPEKNEVYQGYAAASMGIGLLLGPVIASSLIETLQYFWTLISFAVVIFILGMGAFCFIPKRIDDTAEQQK